MQFSGIFFIMTELCPPDPRWTEQALLSLLCQMLTTMEAVDKKTKTFLKLFILQVHVCTCEYACMPWYMCAHVIVCASRCRCVHLLMFQTLYLSSKNIVSTLGYIMFHVISL